MTTGGLKVGKSAPRGPRGGAKADGGEVKIRWQNTDRRDAVTAAAADSGVPREQWIRDAIDHRLMLQASGNITVPDALRLLRLVRNGEALLSSLSMDLERAAEEFGKFGEAVGDEVLGAPA